MHWGVILDWDGYTKDRGARVKCRRDVLGGVWGKEVDLVRNIFQQLMLLAVSLCCVEELTGQWSNLSSLAVLVLTSSSRLLILVAICCEPPMN